MAYTNSKLLNYTRISPNRRVNRNHKIDTVSIHCVVGQCSVEILGSIFASTSKEASSKLAALGYTNIYEFGGMLDLDGEVEK